MIGAPNQKGNSKAMLARSQRHLPLHQSSGGVLVAMSLSGLITVRSQGVPDWTCAAAERVATSMLSDAQSTV